MMRTEPQEVSLYQDTHCPYSERARRALGEKGIFQKRINVPWHERDTLAQRTGTRTTPVAVCGSDFIRGSGEIARYANRMVSSGLDLFPEQLRAEIEAWEMRADELIQLTLPLVIPVWADVLTDPHERDAFLAAYASVGDYKALKNDRLAHWRRVEEQWKKLDAVLQKHDYLLGPLTYADLAVYGSVYLAAQFHAFDVPEVNRRLAAWYEEIRTAGLMRDQEVLLGKMREGHKTHDIDYTRGATRYGGPPHRPEDSNDQTF